MTWFKVDDSFYRSRKVRKLGRDRVAAVGLWTLSGVWSADNLSDGFVPWEVVEDWDANRRLAARLVEVGLWTEAEYDGEDGVCFHDWSDWQPTREHVLGERRYNARKSALYRDPELLELVRKRDRDRCRYCGAKINWKDRRSAAGATYDHVEGDDSPNTADNLVVACRRCNARKAGRSLAEADMVLLEPGSFGGSGRSKNQSASSSYLDTDQNGSGTFQVPDPTRPDPTRVLPTEEHDEETSSSAAADAAPASPPREDVEQLCTRLHDRIVGNGFKTPTITTEWRRQARLLLDTDKRDLDQALRLIDWCQESTFWQGNVLSLPTFRKQYDQLLAKARHEQQQRRSNGRTTRTTDDKRAAIPGLVAEVMGTSALRPDLRSIAGGGQS